jgi:anti-sigma factor RsiW
MVDKIETMNCKMSRKVFANLLFAGDEPANQAARAHIAECTECARELASYEATFSLLDQWEAPEVSPYFDQRLAVRLREAQDAPAAGWFERLRTRLQLNTGRQMRPALATALALVLVVGGGSFSLSTFLRQQPVETSATVNDLQRLDKNEQALQQMDQLLQEDAPAADNDTAPPQS